MNDWRSISPWKLKGIVRADILNAGFEDLSVTRADIIKEMALTLIMGSRR
jgi:hypothetical protein